MTNHWCVRLSRTAARGLGLGVVAIVVLMIVAAQSAPAQTFTTLYAFNGSPDGAGPEGSLIRDSAGNFYGATTTGGTGSCSSEYTTGCGTLFKLDSTGAEIVLYSFAGGKDGAYPIASMVRDADGNFYGTTEFGGGSQKCGGVQHPIGCGTVFKVDASGGETVLHSFTGGKDGAIPLGGVIRDKSGNLFGAAYGGGKFGFGDVFKVDPTGKFTVLYSFTGGADGGLPDTTPVQDASGALYGTAFWGGASGVYGAVYRLKGHTETVLYSFTGGLDAQCPCEGSLILDAKGNLYGATLGGGTYGLGTVFKVNTAGKETLVHSFAGHPLDGAYPLAGVIRDAAGNFYGTTVGGGAYYTGTLFQISSTGGETTLHDFDENEYRPYYPMSSLIRDKKGNLFGMTYNGGSQQYAGTVFELTP